MQIDGHNYRLTKHGRKRFLARVCPGEEPNDGKILRMAVEGVPGFKFVWVPDARIEGDFRLITVLIEGETSQQKDHAQN